MMEQSWTLAFKDFMAYAVTRDRRIWQFPVGPQMKIVKQQLCPARRNRILCTCKTTSEGLMNTWHSARADGEKDQWDLGFHSYSSFIYTQELLPWPLKLFESKISKKKRHRHICEWVCLQIQIGLWEIGGRMLNTYP